MTDLWTDRLSEYLDEGLVPSERAECARHLESCDECAALLESLSRVAARARSLADPPIATDLWPGIAARLPAATPQSVWSLAGAARRLTFTVPQAAAAALLLVTLSGGAVWWALRGAAPGRAPESSRTATDATRAAPSAVVAGFDERHYDAAVADLENTLRTHRADLDTSTVRVLEQNLALIDRSIAQARKALAADPASVYLNGHLARQMLTKLDLLRRATALHEPRG